MASTCISNCVKDARIPVRATYVNLYKWPESDVEFIRSLSCDSRNSGGGRPTHVVDSISCRQLYLRSYTFSRSDVDLTSSSSCIDKDKKKKAKKSTSRTRKRRRSSSGGGEIGGRRKCITGFRRAKESSCAALAVIFRHLLYCTTQIDVVR